MKYTCQQSGNSLDELGIPKNPKFDPSHDSVASFWLIPGGGHNDDYNAYNRYQTLLSSAWSTYPRSSSSESE